jgi:hypothetical protein
MDVIGIIDSYTRWWGRRLDDTAGFLESTAEKLRLLAILTRVAP